MADIAAEPGVSDSNAALRPLVITMGDPAGVGLELAIAAWQARDESGLAPFVLCADPDVVRERASLIGHSVEVAVLDDVPDARALPPERLAVLPVRVRRRARAGQPDAANAAAVIGAIEIGVREVCQGRASALVTLPIAKHVLYAAGFAHPGHTEFLAALAERHVPGQRYHPVMMLAAPQLRVVPLTVHIALAAVPGAITPVLIETTARILADALRQDFGIKAPRIAVAGLNPHAGEGGAIGKEEGKVIAPALERLRAQGLEVTGPHSADTLFHAAAREGYDAVLAMYHDQALIPIKTLAFDTAVNVTLGLPFVRTSPDHGTAFDIAGKGTGSPASLVAAIELAEELGARRAARRPDARAGR